MFDAEVLFQPLKEQLNLPALFVNLRNAQRRQVPTVGQKRHLYAVDGTIDAAAQINEGVALMAALPCLK